MVHYSRKREVRDYIKDKLVILEDFGIVDYRNEKSIKKMLTDAVDKSNEPYDIVLDRISMDMIRKKLKAI